MDIVYLFLNPQCHHYDRFDQSLLEYQEISAGVQESTVSVHYVKFHLDVIVSHKKCQNTEALSKWDQFYERLCLHSLLLRSSFYFVFRDCTNFINGCNI